MAARLCRGILRELSRSSPESTSVSAIPTWMHIKNTLRQTGNHTHSISDLQCYLYYLRSSRRHRELLLNYQGKGERSIAESAKLVGLSLPESQLQEENSDSNELNEIPQKHIN